MSRILMVLGITLYSAQSGRAKWGGVGVTGDSGGASEKLYFLAYHGNGHNGKTGRQLQNKSMIFGIENKCPISIYR